MSGTLEFFLPLFLSGMQGFFSFSLFCWTFEFFFTCFGGSGVLSHGADFGFGFFGFYG